MLYFLAGVAVLILLIVAARLFAAANPRLLADVMRKLGGIVALGGAGFLLVRGALPLAIPLGLFGLSLIKPGMFGFGPFSKSTTTPGGSSTVRTDSLEMTLDHDRGEMEGLCLRGRFEGRTLSSLSESELKQFIDEVRTSDEQATALLEAYLDWRLPGWREAEAGAKHAGKQTRSRRRPGRMTAEEAYGVLGLKPGASEEEISRAHRSMMKKFHPDQGGSTDLAAQINEAKDVLLGR
jgi:DnaJ-domain-containing protein 1